MATMESVTETFWNDISVESAHDGAVQIKIDVVDTVVCLNWHFKFRVYLDKLHTYTTADGRRGAELYSTLALTGDFHTGSLQCS